MYDPNERKGTGRTTRMMDAVDDAFRKGARYIQVVVVLPELSASAFYERMASDLGAECVDRRGKDKVALSLTPKAVHESVPGSAICEVAFMSADRSWDWERMRFLNSHDSCLVFVDHWVIERRFLKMLTELHRYDGEGRY